MKNTAVLLLVTTVLIIGACKAQKRSTPNYGKQPVTSPAVPS